MSKSGSRNSAWSDPPPSPKDPDAFLFMGADPCWTPDREYKMPDAPDFGPGLCDLCGGDVGKPTPFLDNNGSPVVLTEIPAGSHRVCARCMRSGRDQRSVGYEPAPDRDIAVESPGDPGYVERDGIRVPERFAGLMKR